MSLESKRLPKGIRIAESGRMADPGMETLSSAVGLAGASDVPSAKADKADLESVKGEATACATSDCEGNSRSQESAPWGYILIHNKKIETFRKEIDEYNRANPDAAHECFVHYSYKYRQRTDGRGVKRELLPTVSGLVFLQGQQKELQAFLREYYPQYHLINDCSTGRPACIADSVMKPFREVVTTHPENVTFLRDPFEKFAAKRVKLRVLTGLFAGLEGYIVRVDRDRQLVMELGGYAVAISGIHKEDFAIAE